jgi:hypothetical protein
MLPVVSIPAGGRITMILMGVIGVCLCVLPRSGGLVAGNYGMM